VVTAVVILIAVAAVAIPLRFLAFPKGGGSIGVPPGHRTITITEPSESMVPTIAVGQAVVVDEDAYGSAAPSRGDLVAFETDQHPGFTFIKRVIGLPGDTVEQRLGGAVFVNGQKLDEPYVGDVDPKALGPWTVEPGHLFVMGDNRANSNDSRYALGQIPIGDLQGKVLLQVEPTGTPTPNLPPGAVAERGGWLSATYLPPGFELRSASEDPVSAIPGELTYSLSFGRYNSDRSDFDAGVGVTMMQWSPALDVATEVARYPGALDVNVGGHDALFLPQGEERDASTLAWMERDGLLIQVVASGMTEEEMLAVAQGLEVADLDPRSGGTFELNYLPPGFEPLKGGGQPAIVSGPVPRVLYRGFAPAGREPQELVSISQGYASLTSPDLRRLASLVIRGRPATLYERTEPHELAIVWAEEDGLNVMVIGRGIPQQELIAVANGLSRLPG
jgi:signal peptidase I